MPAPVFNPSTPFGDVASSAGVAARAPREGFGGVPGLAPWLNAPSATPLGGPAAAPAPAQRSAAPWWAGAQAETDMRHAAQTAALRQTAQAAAAAAEQERQRLLAQQNALLYGNGGEGGSGDTGNGDGSGDGGDGGSGW